MFASCPCLTTTIKKSYFVAATCLSIVAIVPPNLRRPDAEIGYKDKRMHVSQSGCYKPGYVLKP